MASEDLVGPESMMSPFYLLPSAVITELCDFIDVNSVVSFARVCKLTHSCVNGVVWQRKLVQMQSRWLCCSTPAAARASRSHVSSRDCHNVAGGTSAPLPASSTALSAVQLRSYLGPLDGHVFRVLDQDNARGLISVCEPGMRHMRMWRRTMQSSAPVCELHVEEYTHAGHTGAEPIVLAWPSEQYGPSYTDATGTRRSMPPLYRVRSTAHLTAREHGSLWLEQGFDPSRVGPASWLCYDGSPILLQFEAFTPTTVVPFLETVLCQPLLPHAHEDVKEDDMQDVDHFQGWLLGRYPSARPLFDAARDIAVAARNEAALHAGRTTENSSRMDRIAAGASPSHHGIYAAPVDDSDVSESGSEPLVRAATSAQMTAAAGVGDARQDDEQVAGQAAAEGEEAEEEGDVLDEESDEESIAADEDGVLLPPLHEPLDRAANAAEAMLRALVEMMAGAGAGRNERAAERREGLDGGNVARAIYLELLPPATALHPLTSKAHEALTMQANEGRSTTITTEASSAVQAQPVQTLLHSTIQLCGYWQAGYGSHGVETLHVSIVSHGQPHDHEDAPEQTQQQQAATSSDADDTRSHAAGQTLLRPAFSPLSSAAYARELCSARCTSSPARGQPTHVIGNDPTKSTFWLPYQGWSNHLPALTEFISQAPAGAGVPEAGEGRGGARRRIMVRYDGLTLIGRKVIGDPNVPSGQISFVVSLDTSTALQPSEAIPAVPVATFPAIGRLRLRNLWEEFNTYGVAILPAAGQINMQPSCWAPEWMPAALFLWKDRPEGQASSGGTSAGGGGLTFSLLWYDRDDMHHMTDFERSPVPASSP